MSKLLRSLLATTAFVTLVPTTASALPQYCSVVCEFSSPCDQLCVVGSRTVITCGEWGVCDGARAEPSDASASVTPDEVRQNAESSQVCSEEQPSASAES